jgi:hypothetical protein
MNLRTLVAAVALLALPLPAHRVHAQAIENDVQFVDVTIAAADVLTLNSNPVPLVAGVPGFTVIPKLIIVQKAPGIACVPGSATLVRIHWTAPVDPQWGFPGGLISLHPSTDGRVLTRATGGSLVTLNAGASQAAMYTADSDAAGLGLSISTNANMTSGCEDWKVHVDYILLPAVI